MSKTPVFHTCLQFVQISAVLKELKPKL